MRCDYTVALRGLSLLAALALPLAAKAQTPDAPVVGVVLTSDVLADLPLSGTPFAAVETLQSEIIGDRFTAAGLNAASAPRFGAFLNSWTQTDWRIGDVSVTDPRAGGTPLVLPALPFWSRVSLSTAAAALEDPAAALTVHLDPLRPGARWSGQADGWLSPPGLVAGASSAVPPVDRVSHSEFATALASGPLGARAGLVAGGAWRTTRHVAAGAAEGDDRVASAFGHVVFAPRTGDELRALVWLDHTSSPLAGDGNAVHTQATWERGTSRIPWRVYGGLTQRTQTVSQPALLTIDSLIEDPIADAIDSRSNTTRRWTLGARVSPKLSKHAPVFGVDIEGGSVRLAPSGIARIQETVASVPARAWTFQNPASDDGRHLTRVSARVEDRVALGRIGIEAGVNVDVTSAAADAAASGVSWTTALPRVVGRFHVTERAGLTLIGGYKRSAFDPPLDLLAVGDPAAPTADVAAWNGTTVGPAFARVGPGSGGAGLSAIDANLDRPITDELLAGIESSPLPGIVVGFTWIDKREDNLLQLVNTGVPAGLYAPVSAADPSFVAGSPVGGAAVVALNRPADAYGRDRFLLTNRPDAATFRGIELQVQVARPRWTLIASGAHTRTSVPAAAIGYLPTQNDPAVLGSLLADPNAFTADRGQIFGDRTTAVKIAAVYRFPANVHVGAIARYQDGQPFSRVVLVPGLNQGASAVRSYPNGGTAFTFTGTFDVRLQKIFTRGSTEIGAIADIYNLPNLGNEVSEIVVTGPAFRTPVAQQPPRTMTIGLSVRF